MSEKMKAIIAEQLSVNAEEIKPETNFKEDLGVDSLDLFEMVMAMEELRSHQRIWKRSQP